MLGVEKENCSEVEHEGNVSLARARGSKRHYAIWSQVLREADRFQKSWGDDN